jgi:molybdopterin-guanine dinucleotide biosynthesis protein
MRASRSSSRSSRGKRRRDLTTEARNTATARNKTICVAGTSSGVGKTSVVEMLLRVLKGWSAAKISAGHTQSSKPFGIVTRSAVLKEPGTDTARFLAAGAKRVFWVWCRRSAAKAAVRELLRRLRLGENILVEGNSFARATRPNVTVMVARVGQREMKTSASAILPKVDLILLRADPEHAKDRVRRATRWWREHTGVKDVFVVRSFRRRNAAFVRNLLRRHDEIT